MYRAAYQNLLTNTNFEEDIQEIQYILDLIREESTSPSSEESDTMHPKCVNFVGTINNFDDNIFKSHMRLKRSTVNYLITRFTQDTSAQQHRNAGRPKTSCQAKIYMYIWYISNTITYRQLGNLFGVTKSLAWKVVREVVTWLITFGHEFIKWPDSASAERIALKFEQKRRIPVVIGAMDCTHININAPKVNKECYFDRKQNYSLVLQAVVDADKQFLDIFCGEPGSLHDSRVLRRSDLFKRAQSEYATMFPNASFIIGDSAYSSTTWLVPPFKDNGNLTRNQRNFNHVHSSTRIAVENTFGLLKGRFRRLLRFTEHRNLCAITNIVVSACILHNICVIKDDLSGHDDISPLADFTGQSDNPQAVTIDRRGELLIYLQEHNII